MKSSICTHHAKSSQKESTIPRHWKCSREHNTRARVRATDWICIELCVYSPDVGEWWAFLESHRQAFPIDSTTHWFFFRRRGRPLMTHNVEKRREEMPHWLPLLTHSHGQQFFFPQERHRSIGRDTFLCLQKIFADDGTFFPIDLQRQTRRWTSGGSLWIFCKGHTTEASPKSSIKCTTLDFSASSTLSARLSHFSPFPFVNDCIQIDWPF